MTCLADPMLVPKENPYLYPSITHSCLIIHLVNVTLNRTPISYVYKVNYFFTLPL